MTNKTAAPQVPERRADGDVAGKTSPQNIARLDWQFSNGMYSSRSPHNICLALKQLGIDVFIHNKRDFQICYGIGNPGGEMRYWYSSWTDCDNPQLRQLIQDEFGFRPPRKMLHFVLCYLAALAEEVPI